MFVGPVPLPPAGLELATGVAPVGDSGLDLEKSVLYCSRRFKIWIINMPGNSSADPLHSSPTVHRWRAVQEGWGRSGLKKKKKTLISDEFLFLL